MRVLEVGNMADIHDAETERVPIANAKIARGIQRGENVKALTSHFRRAFTEPMEKVRGYTREELYQQITAPIPSTIYNTISRGYDTCEKWDIVLKYTGSYVFIWLIGIGYVRIHEIRQVDRYKAKITYTDLMGHQQSEVVNWNSEFHMFLGQP
jgi:hypothetical protein